MRAPEHAIREGTNLWPQLPWRAEEIQGETAEGGGRTFGIDLIHPSVLVFEKVTVNMKFLEGPADQHYASACLEL